MLAMFDITSSLRFTLKSRKRASAWTAPSSIMGITPPWRQAIVTNAVAHRAQAYAEHFRGTGTVAAGRLQGHLEQPAFRSFERHSRAQPAPRLTWERRRQIRRLQDFDSDFTPGKCHRAAHEVRELPHVPRPAMTFQPGEKLVRHHGNRTLGCVAADEMPR